MLVLLHRVTKSASQPTFDSQVTTGMWIKVAIGLCIATMVAPCISWGTYINPD